MKKYIVFTVLLVLILGFFTINLNTVSAQTSSTSGCVAGYKFSPLTGEPCNTSTNIPTGCESGYAYSYLTGEKCPTVVTTSSNAIVLDRIIVVGMRGEDVKLVQQFLKDEGYYTGRVDGVYGPVSVRSVRLFQEDNSLTVNGRVDSETVAAINRQRGATYPIVEPVLPVSPAPLPYISSIYPTSGPVGTKVTIHGSNFNYAGIDANDNVVNFLGNKIKTSFASDNASLVFTVPATSPNCIGGCAVTPDTYGFTVSNPRGVSNLFRFTVTTSTTVLPPTCPLVIENGVAVHKCPEGSPTIKSVSGPQAININQEGKWIVSAYDADGGRLTYSVDWGDYASNQGIGGIGIAERSQTGIFYHTYRTAGTFYPTFTVTNSLGKSNATSLSVNVKKEGTSDYHFVVTSPNGGEAYNKGTSFDTGDFLSYSQAYSSKRKGSICTYITESNNAQDWKNKRNYYVGCAYGFNANNNGTNSGSIQINNSFSVGSYYLLGIWASDDGVEQRHDFSDRSFTIKSSTTVSQGTLTIEPNPVNLKVGESVNLVAWYNYPCVLVNNGGSCLVQQVQPTWSVENTSIASIVQAVPRCALGFTCPPATTQITGNASGTTYLTAIYKDPSTGKDIGYKVNVTVEGSVVVVPTLSITTSSFPMATSGQVYGVKIEATGGADSYNWSLLSGSLPPGITEDRIECITSPCKVPISLHGTPTTPGSYTFTYQVTSGKLYATKQFTINVTSNVDSISSVIGFADEISCNIIGGWAINQNRKNDQTVIRIYSESSGNRKMLSYLETTGLRPDVNDAHKVTGNHGFTINTPASVKDGNSYKISVMAVGDNQFEKELNGSPKTIVCPSAYSIGGSNLLASPLASLPVASTPSVTQSAPVSSYYFTQFLSEGAYGEEVSQLQKRLAKLGYYAGNIDSNFGPNLKEAVQKLQSANNLKVDGIVGYEVRTFLNN